MTIIGWLIIGALAGWIASLIAGTNAQQGWLMNIVVGIVGAFFGGVLYSLLTGGNLTNGFDMLTFMVVTFSAIIFLTLYRAVTGRPSRV